MSQDSILSSEPDSDRRIPVLQTGALTASPSERLAEAGGFEPPGRSPARIVSSDVPSASRPCFLSVAGIEGFEPPAHGLTVRCSAAELYPLWCVSEGNRTLGHRSHNPALFHLSYRHHVFRWNPEDSDLVLGIFSPAHRPSLPRLHGTLRKTRTSICGFVGRRPIHWTRRACFIHRCKGRESLPQHEIPARIAGLLFPFSVIQSGTTSKVGNASGPCARVLQS